MRLPAQVVSCAPKTKTGAAEELESEMHDFVPACRGFGNDKKAR